MDFFGHFGSDSTTPGVQWLPGMLTFVVVGTAVYHVIGFVLLRAVLLRMYSRCSWWSYLATYKGILCKDVQKEIQYISIAGCHHLLGGGLMAYGSMAASPQAFAAGALVGVWDDLHDIVCMLLPAWPFGGNGEKIDVKLTALLLIHHVAAIMCTFPAIVTGLYVKPHVQAVGAWLLLAGGVSHMTLAISRTCDRRRKQDAQLDALIWLFGAAFYIYARLYAFPREMMAVYQEDFHYLSPCMKAAIIGFTFLMGSFNVLISFDVIGNTVKRVRNVLYGSSDSKKD